jgi:hypothetical protein
MSYVEAGDVKRGTRSTAPVVRWCWIHPMSPGGPPPGAFRPIRVRAATRMPLTPGAGRFVRIVLNLVGATVATLFARASLQFYAQTHRLIGGLFFIEQAWFAIAFVIRRPPQAVSRRIGSWLLAFGGTFGGLLLRPEGLIRRGACRLASACSWLA